MLDNLRAQIRAAIRAGDMERAWFLVRIVVSYRLAIGEINVSTAIRAFSSVAREIAPEAHGRH